MRTRPSCGTDGLEHRQANFCSGITNVAFVADLHRNARLKPWFGQRHYAGLTANERFELTGFRPEFDTVANLQRRSARIRILVQIDVEGAGWLADMIFAAVVSRRDWSSAAILIAVSDPDRRRRHTGR